MLRLIDTVKLGALVYVQDKGTKGCAPFDPCITKLSVSHMRQPPCSDSSLELQLPSTPISCKSKIASLRLISCSPSPKYIQPILPGFGTSSPTHHSPCQKPIPESSMSFSDINLIQVCLCYLVAVLHMP